MYDKYNLIANDNIRQEVKEITLKRNETGVLEFDFIPNSFICSINHNNFGNTKFYISSTTQNIDFDNPTTYDIIIENKQYFTTIYEKKTLYVKMESSQQNPITLKVIAFNFEFKPELINNLSQFNKLMNNLYTFRSNMENILEDINNYVSNTNTSVNGIYNRLESNHGNYIANILEDINNYVSNTNTSVNGIYNRLESYAGDPFPQILDNIKVCLMNADTNVITELEDIYNRLDITNGKVQNVVVNVDHAKQHLANIKSYLEYKTKIKTLTGTDTVILNNVKAITYIKSDSDFSISIGEDIITMPAGTYQNIIDNGYKSGTNYAVSIFNFSSPVTVIYSYWE